VVADLGKEEKQRKSMLELASLVLRDANKALEFNELYDKVSETKGFNKKEKEERIGQFYTEINVDGRFMTTGSNIWGLKEWYPVDQHDEQVTSIPDKEDDLDEELEYEPELVELGEEEKELNDTDDLDDDEDFDEDLAEDEVLDTEIDLDDEEKI
jgi:DNA-directed RNA polymerase subunit delta